MKEYEVLLEMVNRLEEMQQDLFCSGFLSAPEYVFRGLQELKEEAAAYGMEHYEGLIANLQEQLGMGRHRIQKEESQVMEAYVNLFLFNQRLKLRLRQDQLKEEMLLGKESM